MFIKFDAEAWRAFHAGRTPQSRANRCGAAAVAYQLVEEIEESLAYARASEPRPCAYANFAARRQLAFFQQGPREL
jgi:hypothetical protein